jgi:hypothetical protein
MTPQHVMLAGSDRSRVVPLLARTGDARVNDAQFGRVRSWFTSGSVGESSALAALARHPDSRLRGTSTDGERPYTEYESSNAT